MKALGVPESKWRQEMAPPLNKRHHHHHEEDVADGGQAGVRDVGEGSVCVALDNAWQGVVDSAPLKRNFLARLKVSQYLFRSGHVWLACCGHVSSSTCWRNVKISSSMHEQGILVGLQSDMCHVSCRARSYYYCARKRSGLLVCSETQWSHCVRKRSGSLSLLLDPIRKKLVRRLLEEQDKVLRSYFAQKGGTRSRRGDRGNYMGRERVQHGHVCVKKTRADRGRVTKS
jgi:hypothetical protein